MSSSSSPGRGLCADPARPPARRFHAGPGARGFLRRCGSLCLAVMVPLAGCGARPVSKTGYEYAKALYSVANRQAAGKIDPVQQQIARAEQSGELPAGEAERLLGLCQQCRDGDWASAQAGARTMMTQAGNR